MFVAGPSAHNAESGRPLFKTRDELVEKIAAVEAASALEVVLMLQPTAGSYRDVDLLWGAIFALVALIVAVHSPLAVDPDGLVWNTALIGLLGWFLSRRIPAMRRLLTSAARRGRQVTQFSQMAFTELRLTHTRDRSGLLLACFELEQRALLLPDLGVTARVPPAVLAAHQATLDACATFAELETGVAKVLDDLTRQMPDLWPCAHDDLDELDNAVVTLL